MASSASSASNGETLLSSKSTRKSVKKSTRKSTRKSVIKRSPRQSAAGKRPSPKTSKAKRNSTKKAKKTKLSSEPTSKRTKTKTNVSEEESTAGCGAAPATAAIEAGASDKQTLRDRIVDRLERSGVDLDGDGESTVGGEEDGHSLAKRIERRLSLLQTDASTPTADASSHGNPNADATTPPSIDAATPPPLPNADATTSPSIEFTIPPPLPKATTKDHLLTIFQAHFRGVLIRKEQKNVRECTVRLLRVRGAQWVVVGQGHASLDRGRMQPCVRVRGWLLHQRAWDSNRTDLLRQPLDWARRAGCDEDGVGPPIFVISGTGGEIYGLEYTQRDAGRTFGHDYEAARQEVAVARLQRAVRGHIRRRRDEAAVAKGAAEGPEQHIALGTTIQMTRGLLKKKKTGQLIDFNNFTGMYKVQLNNKVKWYDLERTTYTVMESEAAATEEEDGAAAAAAAAAASASVES